MSTSKLDVGAYSVAKIATVFVCLIFDKERPFDGDSRLSLYGREPWFPMFAEAAVGSTVGLSGVQLYGALAHGQPSSQPSIAGRRARRTLKPFLPPLRRDHRYVATEDNRRCFTSSLKRASRSGIVEYSSTIGSGCPRSAIFFSIVHRRLHSEGHVHWQRRHPLQRNAGSNFCSAPFGF